MRCGARVGRFEARAAGGLRLRRRDAELREAARTPETIERQIHWRTWYDRSFPRHLVRRGVSLCDAGLTATTIENIAAGTCVRPFPRAQEERTWVKWQSTVVAELITRDRMDISARLRHRLARWPSPHFPREGVARIRRMLDSLRTLVAPRVAAAVLRTLYSGWTTQRRFQRGGHAGWGVADRKIASSTMPIAPMRVPAGGSSYTSPTTQPGRRVASFVSMGAWGHQQDDSTTTRRAVWNYTVYRAVMLQAHDTTCSTSMAVQALPQFERESVRYHPRSAGVATGSGRDHHDYYDYHY